MQGPDTSAIDWTEPDFVFLKKRLEKGEVSLFLGAGFSRAAQNSLGSPTPLAKELSEILAEAAGLPYQGETLRVVADTAISALGTNESSKLIKRHFTIAKHPEGLSAMTDFVWRRIFTTNVDDLIEKVYQTSPFRQQNVELKTTDSHVDALDPTLQSLQVVHLHGHVHRDSRLMVFTDADYARIAAKRTDWYAEVADNIQFSPFCFVGTSLDEPALAYYLALRQEETSGKQLRPKSFLISPNISPIHEKRLSSLNIRGIRKTFEDFLRDLAALKAISTFDRESVSRRVNPHVAFGNPKTQKIIAQSFDFVSHSAEISPPMGPIRSAFHFGTEPNWHDIRQNLDAVRDIADQFVMYLKEDASHFRSTALLGAAGSGKTSVAMRCATTLAQLPATSVWFAKPASNIGLRELIDVIEQDTQNRSYVFIDNCARQLQQIDTNVQRLRGLARLTLVIIERSNAYYHKCGSIRALDPREFEMPDLDESDAVKILEKLKQHGNLGILRGRPMSEQISAFMERASKQLLVAMKEATSGKGSMKSSGTSFPSFTKMRNLHTQSPVLPSGLALRASIAGTLCRRLGQRALLNRKSLTCS
jgi:hypothetical protein